MPDELVPIATFVTPAQAAAARCALEAQGIVSFLKDDNLVGMNWLLGNAVGYVKLLVSEADARRARSVLDTPYDWASLSQHENWKCRHCGEESDIRFDHCQHCGQARLDDRPDLAAQQAFANSLIETGDETKRRAANPYASPRPNAAEHESAGGKEADDDHPASSARCPSCSKPRMAVCPYCRTSGTRFRAADTFGDGITPNEEPLLLCPICDEPFEGSFLRLCEWCGHDFGSGVEAPEIVREASSEPLNWRVLLVGVGGAALVAGLVGYFAVLLS